MNSKKSNKVSLITLFQRSIAILSILLISLSSASLVFNSNASKLDEGVYKNPEAMLNVTFNNDTYMDNIIDNVLPRTGESRNRYGVSLISGLTKIGTVEELVTVSGEYSRSNIKREYKKEVGTFLSKIEAIKNNGTESLVTKNDKNEEKPLPTAQKEELKKELNKFTKDDVSKARWGYLWGDSKILSLNILGFKETVTNIHELLKQTGHVKSSELIITKDIETQISKTQSIIEEQKLKNQENKEGKSELEIISQVSQDEYKSNLSEEKKSELDKFNFLTEDKIKLVDTVTTKDQLDNYSVNQDGFDKLNIPSDEKDKIKVMINDYNNSPSYVKNNIQEELKDLKYSDNILPQEMIVSFVDGVKYPFQTQAGKCANESSSKRYYWGYRNKVNDCIVQRLKFSYGFLGTGFGIATVIICSSACGLIGVFLATHSYFIDYINSICGNEGIYIDISWVGIYKLSQVC